ncbi:MAG TPA: alternative ribosome rescue aminoacyl-tRNA hydrolase ArfB [Bacteroidales bacterium]|nr:alternative ribosome rescue aminoacyl-tRNA hydrolase ArfB [Bacteroidales bacterium]
MNPEELKQRNFENEFVYSSSRSGGPGGQNVNKVNTKIELRFGLILTSLFSESEKEIIFRKLKNKINSYGELILVSQSERTQLMNKKIVTEKFYDLIAKALTKPVKRRSTRPTLSSKLKRLEGKKKRGYIKRLRNDSGELP